MKRDTLLDTMRRLAQSSQVPEDSGDGDYQGCPWCGQEVPNGPCHYDETEDVLHLPECKIGQAIRWLERLPAGCELVGFRPDGQVVYDFGVVRGSPFEKHVWVEHPDDLTKVAKKDGA